MEALIFTNKIRVLLIVFSFALVGCKDKRAEITQAEKIEYGMTKQEVIMIMGGPNIHKIYDNTLYVSKWKEAFYYDVSFFLSSEQIIIWFDSTSCVGQITLPKGTRSD